MQAETPKQAVKLDVRTSLLHELESLETIEDVKAWTTQLIDVYVKFHNELLQAKRNKAHLNRLAAPIIESVVNIDFDNVNVAGLVADITSLLSGSAFSGLRNMFSKPDESTAQDEKKALIGKLSSMLSKNGIAFPIDKVANMPDAEIAFLKQELNIA